ncbi:MAG: signal peptidase II [Actinomycetota bacterium]|nr:signal peptidase II [Actinomycetota bacterium]
MAGDVVTKYLVVSRLEGRVPVRLLGGLVYLGVSRNSGAAFSIAQGATIVFTAVAVAVIVVIARTATRLRSGAWAVSLGLLLGGATGNLLDRVFRAPGPLRGAVVDFIDFRVWPVFNLADSGIVIGGILAVILASRGIDVDGTRRHSTAEPS